MDTLAPAPPLAPDVAADTRRRRWPWVTSIVLAVALSAMFLWLLNWEPLGAQSTVFSAYPPDRMIATHMAGSKADRTRPLCPYPQVAKYKGTGSTDEAANFACQLP